MTQILEWPTIEHNLQVFLRLDPYQKLVFTPQYRAEIDTRYFQSVRRATDWWVWSVTSSRQATYNIICLTYDSLKHYPQEQQTHRSLIVDSLTNLLQKMAVVYPTYVEMNQALTSYQAEYRDMVVTDIRELSSFEPPDNELSLTSVEIDVPSPSPSPSMDTAMVTVPPISSITIDKVIIESSMLPPAQNPPAQHPPAPPPIEMEPFMQFWTRILTCMQSIITPQPGTIVVQTPTVNVQDNNSPTEDNLLSTMITSLLSRSLRPTCTCESHLMHTIKEKIIHVFPCFRDLCPCPLFHRCLAPTVVKVD